MKRLAAILSIPLLAALTLPAQGRGRGHMGGMGPVGHMPSTTPGSLHSNAPTGTSAASADRDTGRDRASDAGRGNKKGLQKKHKKQKRHKAQNERDRDRNNKL
ncbi:MAG TPA: hypothetical protein VEU62_16585 [Bryobacterales bacterium]|nr:hypothetical protein [Bryobacterales bacterium]